MSNSFPGAIEISLTPTARHWLAWGAAGGLSLLAAATVDPDWRLAVAATALGLAGAGAARLARVRWRRAVWQPSGALRLEGPSARRIAQLGPHCYRSRWLIVLHMTRGGKSWYFAVFRGDQPETFRRCAARLRLAGRLHRIR